MDRGTHFAKPMPGMAAVAYLLSPVSALSLVSLSVGFMLHAHGIRVSWLFRGLANVCLVLSPVAAVLGVIAIVRARREPALRSGISRACAAIVVGLFATFVALLFRPMVLSMAREADTPLCCANLHRLAADVYRYADSHGKRFPDPDAWRDKLRGMGGIKADLVYGCADGNRHAYAMNALLRGLRTSDVKSPDQTVMLYECRVDQAQWGRAESTPRTPFHDVYVVAMADGSVRVFDRARFGRLNWDPKRASMECDGSTSLSLPSGDTPDARQQSHSARGGPKATSSRRTP